MTQKDLQSDRTKPDAIGMGSYNSDSHNVERIVGQAGTYATREICRFQCSPIKSHSA